MPFFVVAQKNPTWHGSGMAKANVGQMVKRYRKEHGLTQTETARLCGVSRQHLAAIEAGHVPSLATAEKVMVALGLTLTIGRKTS